MNSSNCSPKGQSWAHWQREADELAIADGLANLAGQATIEAGADVMIAIRFPNYDHIFHVHSTAASFTALKHSSKAAADRCQLVFQFGEGRET